MARIPFQKPKHIEWEINSDRYARLVAEPFEKGYALTVGNSLRRTLLSIIPGAAVTWVRIPGVSSAEGKIPGVQEETVDVLLNLRKLALNVPSGEALSTRLEATGPKQVTLSAKYEIYRKFWFMEKSYVFKPSSANEAAHGIFPDFAAY